MAAPRIGVTDGGAERSSVLDSLRPATREASGAAGRAAWICCGVWMLGAATVVAVGVAVRSAPASASSRGRTDVVVAAPPSSARIEVELGTVEDVLVAGARSVSHGLPRPRSSAPSVAPPSGFDAESASERALLERARSLVARDPETTLALLETRQRRFGLTEPATQLLGIEALVREGRIGASHARAAGFYRSFPDSPLCAEVERLTGYHPRPLGPESALRAPRRFRARAGRSSSPPR